jgi:hypothetical protein
MTIHEATILLVHENSEVGTNFIFFGEAELAKLMVIDKLSQSWYKHILSNPFII